jgi:signal transduction histidine kinase
MNEEYIEFDFSGKSNEEILSLFFHEIRSPIASLAGYLSMLKLEGLREEDTRKFIDIASKLALFVQENVNDVFRYLDEQRKD